MRGGEILSCKKPSKNGKRTSLLPRMKLSFIVNFHKLDYRRKNIFCKLSFWFSFKILTLSLYTFIRKYMHISLRSPSDFHTHLRGWSGDPTDPKSARPEAILESVSALQWYYTQALVMPNLLPKHIETAEEVDTYRAKLDSLLPVGTTPIMTISLKPTTTPEIIRSCRGKIGAVKYYPGWVTTNSGGSTGDIDPDDEQTKKVFEAMIECGVVLSLHPETTVSRDGFGMITKGFVHRAEREFRTLAERIARNHPALQIVIEHISTREMAELINSGKYPNLWATVTPQHLLCTAHDKEWGHAFETHLHCKPTLKDPEDLLAIQKLVYSGNKKVFFGSDSAPHPQDVKECAHCASGVFSSPVAIQIVTDWWMSETTSTWWGSLLGETLDESEKISRLQRFFADNGESLYGRSPIEKTITLENTPFTIPASYPTKLLDLTIIPMWAGKEIGWKMI